MNDFLGTIKSKKEKEKIVLTSLFNFFTILQLIDNEFHLTTYKAWDVCMESGNRFTLEQNQTYTSWCHVQNVVMHGLSRRIVLWKLSYVIIYLCLSVERKDYLILLKRDNHDKGLALIFLNAHTHMINITFLWKDLCVMCHMMFFMLLGIKFNTRPYYVLTNQHK